MRLTEKQLRRIIFEEMQLLNNNRRQKLQEGTSSNPVKITAEMLNRIIKEEYVAFTKRKRLAEARRRRLAEARRRRRR